MDVLVAGKNCGKVADEAARLEGISKVLLAQSDVLANQLAEPMTDLIVKLADDYDTLIAPASASAKNIMPRVAARLDVMQISEIIAVQSADTFERPIYAGNAIQTVQSRDCKKVITVRTASFSCAGNGETVHIENISDIEDSGPFLSFRGKFCLTMIALN